MEFFLIDHQVKGVVGAIHAEQVSSILEEFNSVQSMIAELSSLRTHILTLAKNIY